MPKQSTYATEDTAYRDTVLEFLNTRLHHGATVTEVKAVLDPHHGHTSSALSWLHENGLIARVNEKRGGCKVYVHGDYVNGRENQPYGRRRYKMTEEERGQVAEIERAILRGYGHDEDDIRFLVDLVERLA